MRKIYYVVPDHCAESRYKINTQFYGDKELIKSFIAQECAEDYWDNRDGYEDSWPLNFKLYDSEDAIEPFFECLVGVQFKPDFTAYNPKKKSKPMQANKIIKRLGYEKAKVLLQGLGNEHDAALLEYRRANNIFEVGDLVVSNCSNQENRVFVYKITIGKNIVVNCKRGKGYCYPKKWFRHADDKEIEAGRRLDLPETVIQSLGEVS